MSALSQPAPRMNLSPAVRPTRVRYGVLGFAGALAMITYLDRVCFGTVAPLVQSEFRLSESQLGLLFAAFALAYSAFEVPSGWLGDVFGPRRTLIRIVLWWSVFTALTGAIHPTPWWPGLGFLALLAVRFLFGLGEAGAFPNIARAFHNWFPLEERGSAQGAVWMAGRLAGGLTPLVVLVLLYRTPTVDPEVGLPTLAAGAVGLPASPGGQGPYLAAAVLKGAEHDHWRHAFWVFGALGVAWCVAFAWWFRDRPEQHAGVGPAELAWIRHGRRGPDSAKKRDESGGHGGVPWRRILTSGNLWVLCLQYFCGAYGWYFNITYLPKYLDETYRVNRFNDDYGIVWTSLMAGAPLLLGSLACLVGGLLTDQFIRRTGDRKWGRRLFGVAGHGTCAACYFLALFAPSAGLFVLAVALAAFFNDLTMGSAWASCLDIGGKYSGIVSGCMNTVGNLGGAVAGTVTGWVVDSFGRGRGWQVNFASFAAVYVVAALLWLRFDASRPVVAEEE